MEERVSPPLKDLFVNKPTKSRADQVYERIRDMIDSARLKPGYVFPNETEMCQRMHIGRSTLREAYKQLTLAGYLTRTRRGTFVNDREAILGATPLRTIAKGSSVEELREFRLMLECQTAQLATVHSTEEDLVRLASVQEELVKAKESLDLDAMMRLDKVFHADIAAATHNQLFIVSMSALSAVWNEQVLHDFHPAVEEDQNILNVMITDHDAILMALWLKDGKAASKAMYEHITHASL